MKHSPKTGKHEAVTVVECNQGSVNKFVEALNQKRYQMHDSQAATERALIQGNKDLKQWLMNVLSPDLASLMCLPTLKDQISHFS